MKQITKSQIIEKMTSNLSNIASLYNEAVKANKIHFSLQFKFEKLLASFEKTTKAFNTKTTREQLKIMCSQSKETFQELKEELSIMIDKSATMGNKTIQLHSKPQQEVTAVKEDLKMEFITEDEEGVTYYQIERDEQEEEEQTTKKQWSSQLSLEDLESKGIFLKSLEVDITKESSDDEKLWFTSVLLDIIEAYKKPILSICYNQTKELVHVIDRDDAFQELIEFTYKYPQRFNNLNWFFSVVKKTVLNITRKEVRRYHKIKGTPKSKIMEMCGQLYIYQETNNAGIKTAPLFDDIKELRIDLKSLLNEQEETIYYGLYKGLKWKEIEELEYNKEGEKVKVGNIDRKVKPLKEKIKQYWVTAEQI